MENSNVYASPRAGVRIEECYFYHTIDIPGHGLVQGEWDLRGGEREYLGGVDFKGKRVLEIGTASGFLCFTMERMGAEVVAYDLSPEHSWDAVPYARSNLAQFCRWRRDSIRMLNSGFWFCHRAFGSKAKAAYGTVYTVPDGIGMVDISTVCSVLLHVRDPFLALQNALRLTKETVVITDKASALTGRTMEFLPDYRSCDPEETWWNLSPQVIQEFIGVLGFEKSTVTYHRKNHRLGPVPLFTIVGERTRPTLLP